MHIHSQHFGKKNHGVFRSQETFISTEKLWDVQKKSSFRRCSFLNCRVDMSWTTGKARWAIPAPSPVVSKRPKRRTNSKGWASETAHPIPIDPPFFGAFFESGGKGWMVDSPHFPLNQFPVGSHSSSSRSCAMCSLRCSEVTLPCTLHDVFWGSMDWGRWLVGGSDSFGGEWWI